MKKNRTACPAIVLGLAFALSGCGTRYAVSSVEGTRILVDSRYDRNPDAGAVAFLAPYKHQVDSLMMPVVGYSAHAMSATRPESDLSNLLADIMVWAGGTCGEQPQLGVYNVGGIRADLPAGNVTKGHLLDIAPFENKLVFLTLTGDKLLQLFREIAHRGGEGVSSGVRLVITPSGELLSATLHGKEIDPQASYRIATLDYLAQGNDQLTAFKAKTNVAHPKGMASDSRFVIEAYFVDKASRGEKVDARVEGRIIIKE